MLYCSNKESLKLQRFNVSSFISQLITKSLWVWWLSMVTSFKEMSQRSRFYLMVLPSQHTTSVITIRGQERAWGNRQELFTDSGQKRHMSFMLIVHLTARDLGRVGESMVIWSSLNICPCWFSFSSVGTLYDVIYLATLEFQPLKSVLQVHHKIITR